jgi:uncharacterized protein with PIN domain
MPEINENGQRVLRCDFCGEVVAFVRRVAIDTDYERLQTPHKELYACESCSAKKDRARLGADPS